VNRFKRTLSLEPFRTFANEEGGNWWKDLLRLWQPSGFDGGLRVALRHNALNFYAKGQSVAKVSLDRLKRPCMSVHVKYVTDQIHSKPYLRFDSTGSCLTEGFHDLSIEPGKSVSRWMANTECFFGDEKKFVDEVVSKTPSIIDLEMGLPSLFASIRGPDGILKRPDTEDSGPPRMDIVSLESTNGGYCIVFWEVKLIDDGRLVSDPALKEPPEVVRQLERYKTFIENSEREKDVIDGYVKTCDVLENLLEMAERLDNRGRDLPRIVRDIVENSKNLTVDPLPRLLIYRLGHVTNSWSDHLQRLRDKFKVRCFEVTEACDLATLPKPQQ
jgi:hypothetical protein